MLLRLLRFRTLLFFHATVPRCATPPLHTHTHCKPPCSVGLRYRHWSTNHSEVVLIAMCCGMSCHVMSCSRSVSGHSRCS